MREDDAAESSPGVLPAIAGATACPWGALCCSLGNGFIDRSVGGGGICSLLLPLRS